MRKIHCWFFGACALAWGATGAMGQPFPSGIALDRFAHPRAYLVARPDIDCLRATPLTDEEKERFRGWIDDLTHTDRPYYGMSATLHGTAFAPIPSSEHFSGGLIQINHRLAVTKAFTELVKAGPRAMPALLEALSDRRPTNLELSHHGGMGGMWCECTIPGNPANEREINIIERSAPNSTFGRLEPPMEHYTLTVGDVCLVIIGEITGRNYAAAAYRPTNIIIINSPTEEPEIARLVREIWSGEDPNCYVFESLLTDWRGRGIHNGRKGPDDWSPMAQLQAAAAMRLLYYFPEQGASLIAQRLDELDVKSVEGIDARFGQVVSNGIYTKDLLDAVAWSDHPQVRGAIGRVLQRANSPMLEAMFADCISPERKEGEFERLQQYVEATKVEEPGPYGSLVDVLVVMVKIDPVKAQVVFEKLVDGSMHQRQMVCYAIRRTKPPWSIAVIAPLLRDKQKGERGSFDVSSKANSPRLAIRICDEAALTIHAIEPDLKFALQGTYEELDLVENQIAEELVRRLG